jgi:hypothetical protein
MKISMLFWPFAAIPIIFGLLLVFSAGAEEPREIAKKAFPSVVMLVMHDSAGQPLSLGSGFFVKESVVATNLHVVSGAAKGYAKIVGQKTKYEIAGYVAIDEQRDLVLLKIKDANAPVLRRGDIITTEELFQERDASAPVLPLGDSTKVSIGDEIFAIGNPQGLEGTFSKGIVSAIRNVGQDSLLQITAPISPGSSGGPVLNQEGKVIGIAVATFKEGQNLNFAIPASYLSPLLADTKPIIPLSSEKDTPKKAKSILSDLGGRNTQGVTGEKLTWDSYSQIGDYSLSLHNRLRESVRNVYCLIVFYDTSGSPIDFSVITYSGLIPGGLSKRINGNVEDSTERLNSPLGDSPPRTPRSRIDFRILDFQIVEEGEDVF